MVKKLKPVVASLDEVPEALRDLYEREGEGYALALDDIDSHPGVGKLASAFRREKEARKEAMDRLKALQSQFGDLGDLEPDQIKEQLGKLQQIEDKQLLDAGKVEELFVQRTDRMKKDYEKQLKLMQDQLAERDGVLGKTNARLSEVLVDHSIAAAAARANVRPTALPDVLNRGRSLYRLVEDQVVPLDANGQMITGKNPALALDMDEWLAGLQADAPHLFEPSTGAGAPGARPNGVNGGFRKTISMGDSKAISQNLEQVARGEFRFTD
jgi:hypothetical protein